MPLPALLTKLNKEFEPYVTFLTMLTVIIVSTISIYNFVIRPRDLSVYVKRQEVSFPVSINEKYIKVYNYLVSSCKDTAVDSAAWETYRYLQNTNDYWKVTLHNETGRSIKGITLRVTNVSSLSAWAVNGNYLLDEEKETLMKSVGFRPKSGVIILNKIELLPPHMDITLYLWGKLPDLVLDQNLAVHYEDGDGHTGHEITVYGFKAFVCEYLYTFVFVIFLLFFLVYRRIIKKYRHVTP
ncbi:MAG TPA: hypothetical protein VGM30_19525 [Puia sp.]|jgi:hypothetical protein